MVACMQSGYMASKFELGGSQDGDEEQSTSMLESCKGLTGVDVVVLVRTDRLGSRRAWVCGARRACCKKR